MRNYLFIIGFLSVVGCMILGAYFAHSIGGEIGKVIALFVILLPVFASFIIPNQIIK